MGMEPRADASGPCLAGTLVGALLLAYGVVLAGFGEPGQLAPGARQLQASPATATTTPAVVVITATTTQSSAVQVVTAIPTQTTTTAVAATAVTTGALSSVSNALSVTTSPVPGSGASTVSPVLAGLQATTPTVGAKVTTTKGEGGKVTTCSPATTWNTNGSALSPLCQSFVPEVFDPPTCLPEQVRTYTFLSGADRGKEPYVYNTWMFAQACGLKYTVFRMEKQLPRREVLFKATEAILVNWGVYITGTIVACIIMDCFYIAPRGRRCCGIFEENVDPDEPQPGCTYQKVLGPCYLLCLVPVAVMLFLAACLQFVWQMVDYHQDVQALKGSTCYAVADGSGNVLHTPPDTCADIMLLDWPCNRHMLELLLLAAFCALDFLLIILVKLYTCVIAFISCLRVCCCCCGCLSWKAACNRPDCWCGRHCTLKMCVSWSWCHPAAFCCFNCFIIPLVITLYFLAGSLGAFLAYGLLLLLVFALLFCLEYVVRQLIVLASCGRCEMMEIPFRKYFSALVPCPWHVLVPSHVSGDLEKPSQAYYGDAWQATLDDPHQAGWESQIMGVPCFGVTLTFPLLLAILVTPAVLVGIVGAFCFIWEDYLTRVLSWAKSDMSWYMASDAMGNGARAWEWWWQVFVELLGGLTDAFVDIFKGWWALIVNIFTGNETFWGSVADFMEDGINPMNLFQKSDFSAFRAAMLIWRFILTFIFACCRITALINWSEPMYGRDFGFELEQEAHAAASAGGLFEGYAY